MFIALAIVLFLFIVAFVAFFIFLRKMSFETFEKLCEKKVKRIAKRDKVLVIEQLHLLNYKSEKLGVHHVIFGKKYIYLITDFLLKGFVSGEVNDNSWVYFNSVTKKNHYLSNLNKISEQNIQEFAGILGIKSDPIVSICLIPNECDFNIKNINSNQKMVVRYSSLSKKIKEFEKQSIGSLNEEQIYEQFRTIESKNNEEGR